MNKMKRIFSLVLAFSLVLGTFGAVVPAFAEEDAKVEETEKTEVVETKPETTEEALKEVPKDVIGTDHEAAVRRLVAFGIVGGYPDGTYKPENAVNRAHFSKIIVEALGLADAVPAAEGQDTAFKDVKGNHWAAGYINVASGNGLLKGFPDGTYRPATQVTYAQALTMLVRALGYQDDFLQGTWPGNYVSKAADVGITAGVKIPSNAQEGAKRGYIADLVNNALDAKVVKVETYKPGTSTVEYYETDIPLLKDKLEISKYEDTRIIADKIVDDGLAKDEVRIKFLEDTDRYKKDRYSRGEIVKKDYDQGMEEEFRFENTVNPREIIGEEVTTYINDKDRVIYAERENDDVAHFDYVEKIKNNKLSLVKFDREYEFDTKEAKDARNTYLSVVHIFNNKDDRFDTETDMRDLNKVENMKDLVGRMGKFVVRNNKIVYAEILDPAETPGYMVVLKNDDGQLVGVNNETEDFKIDLRDDKDYDKSLVFNTKGEKLSLKDIKEGNVIYVQEQKYDGDDVAFATVVQDNKIEGEMGRVKHDRIDIADKTYKVVLNKTKENNEETTNYVTSYAVRGLDEVKKWDGTSKEWEDDMEDAYKEAIVAYKDGVGRIAFLTTEGGNSGYKFGIITRTYADSDRIRIYTSIDGKEGKDQVFKADKELDIEKPIELEDNGLEPAPKYIESSRVKAKVGMAVKFRLNSDGEIAKEKLFVMPTTNLYAMTDDFGKDIVKAVKADENDFTTGYKNDSGSRTFAITSDSAVVIDAPKVGTELTSAGNLDGIDLGLGKIDIDDFNTSTWKDIKEDKYGEEIRFYVFPKTNKEYEVDGLVFIGKDGANTGSDEEAVYVLDQWKRGDKLFVEYVKYPENKKETREVDQTDRLTDGKIKKEKAYIGKEKSNGKIALWSSDKEDFDYYEGVVIKEVKGNYITIKGSNKSFLLSGALVYDEDKSKTTSFLKAGMTVDIVSDGIRARVVGKTEKVEADKTALIKSIEVAKELLETVEESKKADLEAAIKAAQKVVDDKDVTQAGVDKAVKVLDEAIEAAKKEVDTTALEAAIEKAEKHEKAEELAEAIKEAKEALEAKTQAEVDAAVKALKDAIAEVEKEEPGEDDEITATYKLDADILGIKSYKITLVNAEIEDIEKVEADGEEMPFEIIEGEYFINVSSGAPTKVVVFVNGQEVVATAE